MTALASAPQTILSVDATSELAAVVHQPLPRICSIKKADAAGEPAERNAGEVGPDVAVALLRRPDVYG